MQNFVGIPFKAEADGGFSSVNGVAKFSSAGIVLEFESKVLGLISKGVKEERLPIAELLDVRFKKGFLRRGAKVEIRLRSFTRLTELPNKEGKLTLKIGVDDWERARDAVLVIQKELGEHIASLPPPATSIVSTFMSEDTTDDLGRKHDR